MDNLIAWRPNRKYRVMSEMLKEQLRVQFGVLVAGQEVPALIKSFKSMRIPKELRRILKSMKIKRPTGLQMQGLPAVLLGRDTLLISISREGKTLIFALPLIVASIQEEKKLKFGPGEGPLGLIIVPSRELAQQIHKFLTDVVRSFKSYPKIKIGLCTGGVDMQDQIEELTKGIHIIISTPGRLSDMLSKQKISLKMCKFLVIDEADRLLDLGFDEEVRSVISQTSYNLQIILSSSSIPKRMQDFAFNFMQSPIYISANKSALKKLRIVQVNNWVEDDKKMVMLLEALLRTEPPILVFCENKNESDEIENFLTGKRLKCTSLHGGKPQGVRSKAIKDINSRRVDVLIATDMAAKGLSFKDIQHIVNFDMAKDIESYIQRICRTSCKATISNFVNGKVDKGLLKDLTGFLVEMGEHVPGFLMQFRESEENVCEICRGGHQKLFCSIFQQDCLKYELPIKPLKQIQN
jgi:ATP-dependent RNA helicase DDX41